MTMSVRSYLTAGLAAATVSALAAVPVSTATPTTITLPSIELSAAVLPLIQPATLAAGAVLGAATEATKPAAAASAASALAPAAAASASGGDAIINAYNAVEPWAQWGFEVAAWAVSYLPWPVGLLGQQVNIAYNSGEPVVQAVVYSFAYLIDGQVSLIGPTLADGLKTSANNFVQGEINWFLSFFPPLPPISFPVFPGAAVASRAASLRAGTAVPPAATDTGTPTAGTGTTTEGAAPTTGATATRIATENTGSGNAAPAAPRHEPPLETTVQAVEPLVETPVAAEAPRPTRAVGRRGAGAQTSDASSVPQVRAAAAVDAPASAGSDGAGGPHKANRPGRPSRSAG